MTQPSSMDTVLTPEASTMRSATGLPTADTFLRQDPTAYGAPLDLEPSPLGDEVSAFVADLSALVGDFARGPLEDRREQSHDFLSGLRRAFMRHYRRIQVRLRSQGLEGLNSFVRSEASELAGRFRDEALARSSRLQHATSPIQPLVDAVDRAVSQLPEQITAPYEPGSFVGQKGDGIGGGLARLVLRIRRQVSQSRLTRVVQLRSLATFHVAVGFRDLEGVVSLLAQADLQLDTRTRNLFAGIMDAFEQLVKESSDVEEALRLLGELKDEVEEELQLVERDQHRHFVDAALRLEALLGGAIAGLKRDLEVAGTFELSMRERPWSTELTARNKSVANLIERAARARDTLAAGFSLTGMQFEYRAFVNSVEEAIAEPISGLEADVRGRSRTQAERVAQALEPLRSFLEPDGSDTGDLEVFEASLREVLAPLERTVQEALRAARQLREQLESEQATTPILDAIFRTTIGLTGRYRVPIAPLRRSEWTIASSPGTIEVPFAEVVTAFVQSDIASRLQSRAATASEDLTPVFAALEDVERLAEYNPEVPGVGGDENQASEGVRQALLTAVETHQQTVAGLLDKEAAGAKLLANDLRAVVLGQLEELSSSFHDDEVSRLRKPRSPRRLRAPKGLRERVERVREAITFWVRRLWNRFAPTPIRKRGRALPLALSVTEDIPAYYRRLFSPQAHWAGSALVFDEDAMDRAVAALRASPPALRSVAVMGPDSSARGAAVAALTRRAEMSSIRRLHLHRPVDAEAVESLMHDLGRQEIVLVSGLGYGVSAKPGGEAGLERLMRAVLADHGRNAWIFDVDQVIWQHLSRRTRVEGVVMQMLYAPSLDVPTLERAIYARHHLSGLAIRFREGNRTEDVGPEGESTSRRSGSIRERYFQELHRQSDGLLQVALQYWLASIQEVQTSSERVLIESPAWKPRESLETFDAGDLRIAYAALRQGWLDPETLESATGLPALEGEARLAHMAFAGLLERVGPKIYQVRRELRGAVQSVLRNRGYL